MSVEADSEVRTVSAVTMKLLPFRSSDLGVWFAQVEEQFSNRGITAQKTTYTTWSRHSRLSSPPSFATTSSTFPPTPTIPSCSNSQHARPSRATQVTDPLPLPSTVAYVKNRERVIVASACDQQMTSVGLLSDREFTSLFIIS